MIDIIKEACVQTLDEALLAQQNGADRIELCSRLDLDGLTPSRDLIRIVESSLTIPIKVMIRPREGDFNYNHQELSQMKDDILFCKSLNISGVVFGILNKENTIDIESTRALLDIAGELDVTFHKAIDQVVSIFSELDTLKNITKVSSILTSGGADNAKSGSTIIKKMIDRVEDKVIIIPAGSITKHNLNEIHSFIGAKEYHGRKIVDISKSN